MAKHTNRQLMKILNVLFTVLYVLIFLQNYIILSIYETITGFYRLVIGRKYNPITFEKLELHRINLDESVKMFSSFLGN